MKIPMYQVDAFTDKVFCGNPAAVCVLESWLADETLQSIAAENFLPETAYLLKNGENYDLRWFTPKIEVDLCGHATLASAFVIFSLLEPARSSVEFKTASGVLAVTKSGDLLSMKFPSRKPVPTEPSSILNEALGEAPRELLRSRDLFAVFDTEKQIRELKPDLEKMKSITDVLGFIVTAKGDSVDFVSRFFAPNAGIPEDTVTGSAHCSLIPYWAERLGKSDLHAFQLSERGGELFCRDMGDSVKIAGRAVLYKTGDIILH